MAQVRRQSENRKNFARQWSAVSLMAAVAMLGATQVASAQWERTGILSNESGEADSHFGAAVAVGPVDLIVAAPDLDALRTDQGAAQAYFPYGGYFYKDYASWDIHGDAWAQYGRSMDFDGLKLIVGAPGENSDAGAAYLRLSGYSKTTLTPSSGDQDTGDRFGRSVSMDDGIVVIGAPGDDERGSDAGAIYVFESPYSSYTKITTSGAGVWFGQGVAIDEGRIAASAPGASVGYSRVGLVRIYEKRVSGWAVIATLNNPDIGVSNFGTSVDISGDIVVVGTETAGNSAGDVYIYDLSRSLTTPVAELESPDGANGDLFGISVAVDGDWVIVGAPLYDLRSRGRRQRLYEDCGAAYTYHQSGGNWYYDTRLKPGFINKDQEFGRAVDIYGEMAVVGAPYKGSNDEGMAYVYEYD